MPQETIEAFQDHGIAEPRLEQGWAEAEAVFEQVAAAGVDYDDVTATLEREGVQKFADSFDELIAGIETSARALTV
jgi:transaldolase